MKIVLVGTGSIGGAVAVQLKDAGYDIDVVAHGKEKADKIVKEGFKITGALGDKQKKINAFGSVGELEGKYDICFIATKFQQLNEVAEKMLPYLKEDSLVVSLQNGNCMDMLADVVGENRTVGCMIGFGATNKGNNTVEVTSGGELYIGMRNEYHPESLERLKHVMDNALPTYITDDIEAKLYSKIIINSCINSIAGITGKTLGNIVEDRTACKVFVAIIREAMDAAKKLDIKVPTYGAMMNYYLMAARFGPVYDRIIEILIKVVAQKKYALVKPSTLQSLEKGQITEIDIMNGYLCETGRKAGVRTPVNDKLTLMIKEIERGERKISPDNLKEVLQ